MVNGIQAHQPPLLQPQDTRSFGELFVQCEIWQMASRIATAVERFFQAIARFLVESFVQVKNWVVSHLPGSDDQAKPNDLAGELRAIITADPDIPAPERDDVLAHALPLIREGMGDWSKREVARAVAAIPTQERGAFVAHVRPLLVQGMSWWSIKCILDAVIATRAPERGDVIDHARLLFTERMDGEEMGIVIEAVSAIPAQERAAVIAHARPLITERMNGRDRNTLIEAIRAIPAADRADVALRARPLIIEGAGDQFANRIVQAIADIPAAQRADVIRRAQELITPQMPGNGRARIITDLAAVPENGRADFVRDWRIGGHRPPPANVNFAQGVNVHEGNRDALTIEAIALLCRHQGAIPEARITQAKDAFVAYLDASRAFTPERKQLARQALLGGGRNGWGALVHEDFFLPRNGVRVSGKELVGRLWIYVSALNPADATNAKDGMIAALEDGINVCGMGKAQRLIVATLQGRLAGVNIEGDVVPRRVARQDAMNLFFLVPERRNIDTLAALIEEANRFCNDNPGIERADFLEDIREYAAVGAIV